MSNPIRILHISDLHFAQNPDFDAEIVTKAFLEDIANLANEKFEIDLICFTGDLVNRGHEKLAFKRAKKEFIDPLLTATGIEPANFFLVPGNHDVSRQWIDKFTDKGIHETLKSTGELNQFIDDVKANSPSMVGLRNYLRALPNDPNKLPATDHPVVKTHNRIIHGHKIGVTCFNTSWRCGGYTEARGALLLGERSVDLGINGLAADNLVNIALLHHPLDWMADWDSISVNDRISAQYHLVLTGHTHVPRIESVQRESEGHPFDGRVSIFLTEAIRGYVMSFTDYDYVYSSRHRVIIWSKGIGGAVSGMDHHDVAARMDFFVFAAWLIAD